MAFKRPIFIAFVVILIILVLVLIRIHTYAWPWLASKPHAKLACEESSWSVALTLDMVENLQIMVWPHAEALLAAEEQLAAGVKSGRILKDLSILPGVNAAIIGEIGGEIYQYPVGAYPVDDLQSQMADYEEEATGYDHPLMQRKVGGLTRFVKWPAGQDSLDIMVYYSRIPEVENRVFGLIFDPKWILNQIPAFMDSLSREDPLLLFWSKSPPDLNEQCIGVTYQGDTLWWQGNRSLETIYSAPSQLIDGLFFHARYHWIQEENDVSRAMPGIRFYFYAAEILFIILVILALFAIRPAKQI